MLARRFCLSWFVLMFSGLVASELAQAAETTKRPNLVFVLTDDQRRDTLGCYGNSFIQTPELDRLAADGTLFENAFITSAICTPSRACYLLGQYERRHGVNFNSGTALSERAWQRSYPVLLRNAGYFTGYVGKNHVPVGERGYNTGILEQSFDYWYGGHGHLKFYPKEVHAIFRNAKADTQVEVLEEGVANFLTPHEDFLNGAAEFLHRRPGDQPFCLSVCFNVPHGAGTSSMKQLPSDPEIYRTLYRDRIDSLPINPLYVAKADIRAPKLPGDVHYVLFRQGEYDYVDALDTLRERMIRQYETVTGVDRFVGRLREQLAALGLADNTVIVFSSDHGIMLGEFGLGGKALNYEPCIRVPMIAYDPRVPSAARGQRRKELVQSIDVAPTLLSAAGVEVPTSMQGRDLGPLVRGEHPEWRDAIVAENLWSTVFGNPRCETVRTANWKYTRYFANDRTLASSPEGSEAYATSDAQRDAYRRWLSSSFMGEKPDYEELFTIDTDPNETTNLAAVAANEPKLAELRRRLDTLLREAKGDVDAAPDTVLLRAEKPKGKNPNAKK
jgi:arylsulfatase A-like enzyme